MMEDHEFCDTCDGCRPAMMNAKTGKVYPRSDPKMIAIDRVWDNDTTFAQRRAYIEVTLKNSRHPDDVAMFQQVITKLQAAIQGVEDD